MADHLWLDFNLVEGFPIVHTNDASNHLWHNDHIPKVSSDGLWLLTRRCFPFRFAELLDKGHWLPCQTPTKPSACTGSEELDELIGGHVEQSIQIDTTEAEFLECPLLWLLSSNWNIGFHIRHG